MAGNSNYLTVIEHPLMEQDYDEHIQTNIDSKSFQGKLSSLDSSNLVQDGDKFLKNVALHLEQIEKDYKFNIRCLLQEVERFRKSGTGSRQQLDQTVRYENYLNSKLESSSICSTPVVRDEMDEGTNPDGSRIVKLAGSVRSESTSGHACKTGTDISSHITQKTPVAQADCKNIYLLLLGSEGNGKSATGNSILGKAVFKQYSSASTTSTISKSSIAKGTTEVGDVTVNVIDGPSIHHSGEVDQDFLENIITSIETSLEICDYAFNAILIVLKLGIRFTKQEAETIKLIKSLLGENVIKDYGICVITHGDNFEHDVEEAAEDGKVLTFESWCRDQSGDVKNLFDECNFKCVLFDNRTKDENKKHNQRFALLNMVDLNKRYSKEEFVKAEGLKELTFKALLPQLEQETKDLLDKIIQEVKEIEVNKTYDPHMYRSKMGSLLVKLQTQKDFLQEFGQSSSLVVVLSQITLLQNNINLKMKQQEYTSKIHSTASSRPSLSTFSHPLFQDQTAETEARVMFVASDREKTNRQSHVVMAENDEGIKAQVRDKWRRIYEYLLKQKNKAAKSIQGLFGTKV